MTVTRVRDLAIVAVVSPCSGSSRPRGWYLRLPALTWPPGATLLLVAAFEFALASRLRAVIGHDPDARPMPAVTVARWVVVGRASALAGAVVSGIGAGFTVYVGTQLGAVDVARGDLVAGLVLRGRRGRAHRGRVAARARGTRAAGRPARRTGPRERVSGRDGGRLRDRSRVVTGP